MRNSRIRECELNDVPGDASITIGHDTEEGKPQTVRYEAVNAMLLNEFLKEHRKNEQQESKIEQQDAKIAQQQRQIEALTEGLQKVSAQLELNKAAPQTVVNNR